MKKPFNITVKNFLRRIKYNLRGFFLRQNHDEKIYEMLGLLDDFGDHGKITANKLGMLVKENKQDLDKIQTMINFLYQNGDMPDIDFKVDDINKLKIWGNQLLNRYYDFLLDCKEVLNNNVIEEREKEDIK